MERGTQLFISTWCENAFILLLLVLLVFHHLTYLNLKLRCEILVNNRHLMDFRSSTLTAIIPTTILNFGS